MTNHEKPRQAYKQKPWRSQVKWISRLLLVACFFMLGAAVYLGLAGEATAVSEELRNLELAKIELQEKIASHQSDLARLSTVQELKPKIEEMGFQRYTYQQVVYVVIPGYDASHDFRLAPSPAEHSITQPIIRYTYTQSLWDWLSENLAAMEIFQGEQP